MSVPNSFTPSDYELLIKSITDGSSLSKVQSLKRLTMLVSSDKKQFAVYAKRVTAAIQDSLSQPTEDLNLFASILSLEIINLNSREIEYHVRTKLLKHIVRNLGDPTAQVRKTSHFCLLAYIKTYKTFDELIQVYLHHGLSSDSWQLRQKSINSFQSILIMEVKYLNWSSAELRRIIEELLQRTLDKNQYVQKAAEQCLVSICKYEEVKILSKKLAQPTYKSLYTFCQAMHKGGLLPEIKLYAQEVGSSAAHRSSSPVIPREPSIPTSHLEKMGKNQNVARAVVANKSLMEKIEELKKNGHITSESNPEEKAVLKKVESTQAVSKRNERVAREVELPSLRKSVNIDEKRREFSTRVSSKTQTNDALVRTKLIDDLKNDKEWKVRLNAIEELQAKFANSPRVESQNLVKVFLPVLISLLADPNFKVALIALKILQTILQFRAVNYCSVIPQMVDKISDGKIALRQNISKLIRNEYRRTGNKAWISELLNQLKKSPAPNSNIKEEILTILWKITMEVDEAGDTQAIHNFGALVENIVESICPLMDDLKTKIKIRTLDLLVLVSVKTASIDAVKTILSTHLNQIYYEMYLERIARQSKAGSGESGQNHHHATSADLKDHRNQSSVLSRKHDKHNSRNTTSSSLKKYSSVEHQNTTARTASFIDKTRVNQDRDKNFDDTTSIKQLANNPAYPIVLQQNLLKSYRKKKIDYKSTQFSTFSSSETTLPPFDDPEKELRNVICEMKSEEWQKCLEALGKLRRIISNHSQLLNSANIRLLVPEVLRLVESLRSNLSKNAVIVLHQMSNRVKKTLDSQLDSIFAKLLKKSLDANSFISEEVRKTLNSICCNCNESKVVNLLIGSHSSRAVPIKLAIVSILQKVTFIPRFLEKQIERIVPILVDFLGEGSLEIRQKSKTILSNVIAIEKGNQIRKMIPSQHLPKLIKSQSKPQVGIELKQAHQAEPESVESPIKKKQKITSFPVQFEDLENLLLKCESSEWKMREKGMNLIFEQILSPFPAETAQHRLGGRVMDVLSKQISDPNVKVASNALRLAQILPKQVPQLVEHNLSVLINQVMSCFGSHKAEIRELSEELFGILAHHIENWMLIQHMCNGALYGLQRSRPVILSKLTQILPNVYSKHNKRTLLIKNLYPMINKIADENKPENVDALLELMRICHDQTNGDFTSNLKPKAISLYNSLLSL